VCNISIYDHASANVFGYPSFYLFYLSTATANVFFRGRGLYHVDDGRGHRLDRLVYLACFLCAGHHQFRASLGPWRNAHFHH
jgi:hypothetical protein